MLKIFVLIGCLLSCKQLGESQLQTASNVVPKDSCLYEKEGSSQIIECFEIIYEIYVEKFTTSLTVLKKLELDLARAISSSQLNLTQLAGLRKMRHKLHSIIIFLGNCSNADKFGDRQIDDQNLCSLVLHKLRAMDYQTIDLSKINEDFYYKTFLAGNYDINKPASADKQQLYRDLLVTINRFNEASMAKYSSMLPFAKINWFDECLSANVIELKPSTRIYAVPDISKMQKNSNCEQLKGYLPRPLPINQETSVYSDFNGFNNKISSKIAKLNTIRAKINNRLQLESNDPAIKKEKLLFVFNILNMTDFGNSDIVKLHEEYYASLVEIAQQGLLPIFLHLYRHRLYLNPKGKWFGLAEVKHDKLKYPSKEEIQQAIAESSANLVKHYLLLSATLKDERQIEDKKIYQWLIQNEIASAQIILQNPQHALVATHLIHVYQDQFRTPQWLQDLKSWSYRLDFLMIPIAIGGSILAAKYAPPLAPTIANAAIAVNLFWIASATSDAVVAFKRYQTVERALLAGTSVNVEQGIKYANDLKEKIQAAIVSGGLGGGLTVRALQLVARQAKWAMTADISAALVSEWTTGDQLNWKGSFSEGISDRQSHKQ